MSVTDKILDPSTVVSPNSLAKLAGLDDFAERLRRDLIEWERHPTPSASETLFNEARFNSLALELTQLQFRANAVFRRLCEVRGDHRRDVGAPRDWSEIPALPTSAFKEMEVSSIPVGLRTAVFHSSGTTSQRPSRHFHHEKSLALYEASLLAFFNSQVLADFPPLGSRGKMLMLTPTAETAPNSSLVHMFETVRRKYGSATFAGRVADDGSWTLDIPEAIKVLENARDQENQLLIMGTAFSFVHLTDALAEKGLQFTLPPGSSVMETGGYKGRSRTMPKLELHRLISQYLGISTERILCEYGMSELSSQAYAFKDVEREERGAWSVSRQDENGQVFQFPPWARVQVVSPETGREVANGETGLIRIFDLANVYSAMAVQTEDLAVRRGTGFELAGRASQAEQRGCSLMAV